MANRVRCSMDRGSSAGSESGRHASKWSRRLGRWLTVGGFVVIVAGCQKKSACETNGVVVDIAGNHSHEASISAEHIRRGEGRMYPLRGGTHQHTMMLTDADMKALQDGKSVTTRSTSVDGHVHEVVVACK